MDDLNCNVNEITAQFMRDYYGNAAGKMTELLNYMQKNRTVFSSVSANGRPTAAVTEMKNISVLHSNF